MSRKFHERFGIVVDLENAKQKFVARVHNLIFHHICTQRAVGINAGHKKLITEIIYELGQDYSPGMEVRNLDKIVGKDFNKNLLALQAIYRIVPSEIQPEINSTIERILIDSEFDLGIRWGQGEFFKSGALLLDEKLIIDSLHWLRNDQKYSIVLAPYEKGLTHFVSASNRPEILADVITDMYEALEALAKVITERDKDLSSNREIFITKVKASEQYKVILKNYIEYANNFRHATGQKPKPNLSIAEVESFIYLTGIFLRLAIQ